MSIFTCNQSSFLAANVLFELCTCLIVWLGIGFQDADHLPCQCGRHLSTDSHCCCEEAYGMLNANPLYMTLFFSLWKLFSIFSLSLVS